MKILYLNPAAQLGGAERSLLDLMTGVRALRPDWELSLIAGEDGPLLAAVSQWKYTPVMFQGRPTRVEYTITVHMKPP